MASLTDAMTPLWDADAAANSGASWLCPSDLDRRRLVEMEGRLVLPRLISYVCILIALFAVQGEASAWIFVLPFVSLANYKLATKRLTRTARPEYVIAYCASVTQAMVLVGVAMSGGPHSPLMVLLVIPFVSFAARFTIRGTIIGVVLTTVLLAAATVGVDPGGFCAHPALVIATVGAFIGVAAFAIALMNAEVEVRQDATRDPLTGVHNRLALRRRVDELQAQRAALAVVVLDIDHFKAVNDTYGHQRGDTVLQAVADEMRSALREGELVYRLGGEEFLVLLPGVGEGEAAQLAERLRAAIGAARPGGLDVTVSLGVSAGADAEDYGTLFERADAALHEAKRSGRDRVVAHAALRPAA